MRKDTQPTHTYRIGRQQELQGAMANWLRETIRRLNQKRQHPLVRRPGCSSSRSFSEWCLHLGPCHIFWIVPRLGVRTAELLEAPIMCVIIIVAARWIVQRLAAQAKLCPRLGCGARPDVAREFSLVWLRGLSIRHYFAPRAPCRRHGLLRGTRCLCRHACAA
jgi:hypothetical protein